MKKIFTAALLLFSNFSFGQSGKNTEAVIKQKFEAMNTHDLEAMGRLYLDSARIQSVGFTETQIGPPGIKKVYTRYFKGSPNLSYQVTKIILKDSEAAVTYTSTGTLSNVEEGTPSYMKGKTYTLLNCAIFKFQDGKIMTEMTYFDQVSFLRQAGFFDHN